MEVSDSVKELGPGFLEKVYEKALIIELTEIRGIPIELHKRISVRYKGRKIGEHHLNILVDCEVIVSDASLKAVKELAPIHEAQLISYLKVKSN